MAKRRETPKCARCGKELARMSGFWRCEPCGYTQQSFKKDHLRPSFLGRADTLIKENEE